MFFLLDPDDPSRFPDPELAEQEPDGLLAMGGDLRPERLLNAYRQGIFPWYSRDEPILWWSPDPRTVLFPEKFHISRSLRKTLRKGDTTIHFDHAFPEVIEACAAPRQSQSDTWITREMRDAYMELHRLGFAHSVEVRSSNRLVGGLYGIALGKVFFGESMFSRISDGSKMAFAGLVNLLDSWDYQLIDCQVHSDHLISLGAEEISRQRFRQFLDDFCPSPEPPDHWRTVEPLASESLA